MSCQEKTNSVNASNAETDEKGVTWEIGRQVGFDKDVKFVRPPSLLRRESFSSPDLVGLGSRLEQVEEEKESALDDSFPQLSTGIRKATTKGIPSFRDVLLTKKKQEKVEEDTPEQPVMTPRRKLRPRLVVTPIRRCVKSTGDLQSLAIENGEEVLGDTDAMEYYHRKKLGQENRKNGMKIRADEAKRRVISMNKKDLQRRQQLKR